MVNHPAGRTSDAQHIAWAFFMPIMHPYSGCHLVNKTALRVSHRSLTNGMCSRFSVTVPGRFSGLLKERCNMQQTIQIGQVQPSILSNAEGIVKNLKAWWNARSETFTALCGTEGDVFTHGDVVKAHLYLVAVLILIGIGGAL